MSRREDIDNAIWDDPDFEALSPNATLLFLWSWTNSRCGMAGIYKVSARGMTQSKVPEEAIPATLEELAAAGFAFYEDSVLWIRSRVKHLRSRSDTMAVSVAKDVEKLPVSHPMRVRFLREYGDSSWLKVGLSRLHRGPIEDPPENPIGKGNSDTPSGTPRGAPWLGEGQGPSSSKAEELPDSFPRELEPHLDAVHQVLTSLAARHRAKAVSRLSLASTLMARPHKPVVRAAHDFASWADGKAQRRKDVAAGYRNWLDKTDDLAGIEALPSDASVVRLQRPESLQRKDAYKQFYDREQAS